MSRTIDQRVVEMKFDNANFERNVDTSISTLDKLKSALRFKETDENFGLVERAAGNLGKSFNVLEELATGALRRMGESAEAWAEKTIKAMSGIENIKVGFSKFGDITRSTGTLRAQGFAMEEIERELGRLNWFTDETSYALADMVDNISKFTAAGQNLTDSSDAMMGIALWAALSGQNAQTASRAMYQLSQAMGTFMKRQDWMSIQNANMDTVEFREKALEAAVAAGTLQKNAEGMYRSIAAGAKKSEWFSRDQFVESLTEGAWFTKDVMMTVFRDYASAVNDIYDYVSEHESVTASEAIELLGDRLDEFGLKAFRAGQEARTWEDAVGSVKDALSTNWMKIFQDIFGTYEEATAFYTRLANDFYDLFVEPVNGLVDTFDAWKELGGRNYFTNGLINILAAIKSAGVTVGETFEEYFFGDKYDKFISTTRNHKIDLDIGGERVNDPLPEFESVTEYKAAALVKITKAFKDFTASVRTTFEESDRLERILNGIWGAFDLVKQFASGAYQAVKPFIGDIAKLFGLALDGVAGLGDWISGIARWTRENAIFTKGIELLLKPLLNLRNNIRAFGKAFLPEFTKRWENLKQRFKDNGNAFGGMSNKLLGLWETLKSKWANLFTNFDAENAVNKIFSAWNKFKLFVYNLLDIPEGHFFEWFNEKLTNASADLEKFGADMKTKFGEYWKTIKEYFFMAKAYITKHWDDITSGAKSAIEVIRDIFGGFWETVKGFFVSEDGTTSGFDDVVETFKNLGRILGEIFGALLRGLKPFADGIKNTLESMSLENAGSFLSGGGLATLALSVYKLVKPVGAFGKVLDAFADTLNGFTMKLNAEALKTAAVAIAILVGSIFVLMSLPEEGMLRSATVLSTIITILGFALKQLSAFSKSASFKKGEGLSLSGSSAGSVLLSMAVAMLLIAVALRMIAKIKTEDLYNAATVIAVLLGIVALVAKQLSRNVTKIGAVGSKNSFIKAGVMGTLIGLALVIATVIFAIKKIEEIQAINPEGLKSSLIIVGGILLAVVAATIAINKLSPKDLPSSVWLSVIAVVGALYLVVMAIQKLTELRLDLYGRFGQIVALLLIFFVGIVQLSKYAGKGDFSSFLKFAGGVVIISVALGLMVGVIYLLSSIQKDLKQSFAAIAIIGVVLGGLMALTSWGKLDPGKLQKIAVGMIGFAAAIAIVAASMYVLSKVNDKDFGRTLALLAAAVVAIAGIGFVMSKGGIGDGFEKFGKTLMYIGIAIAAVAVGFLAVSEAIDVFAGSSAYKMREAASNISTFVDTILVKLPEWIAKIVYSLTTAALAAVPALTAGLMQTALETLDVLLKDDNIFQLVNKLIKVVLKIVEGVTASAGEIVYSVGELLLALLESLVGWIGANSGRIAKAITDLIQAIAKIAVGLLDSLGEKIFGHLWENGNKTGIKDVLETVLMGFLGGGFLEWIGSWVGKLLQVLGPIKTFITGIPTLLGPIKTFITGIPTLLEPIKTGLATILKSIAGLLAAHPVIAAIAAAVGAVAALSIAFQNDQSQRESDLRDYVDRVYANQSQSFRDQLYNELMFHADYGNGLRVENGVLVGDYADQYYAENPYEYERAVAAYEAANANNSRFGNDSFRAVSDAMASDYHGTDGSYQSITNYNMQFTTETLNDPVETYRVVRSAVGRTSSNK